MRVGKSSSNSGADEGGHVWWDGLVEALVFADETRQVDAFDVLHHDEGVVFGLSKVVDLGDVFVDEVSYEFSLGDEHVFGAFAFEEVVANGFDGDGFFEAKSAILFR